MEASQVKKHACQWPGCYKTFSRSDHLQRHRLNHSSQGITCQRCRAHFKRPDLLDRHMNRHRQRDEEAGGEGLGVVETRKRLWEDIDGSVVKNRPLIATPESRGRKRRRNDSQKQGPVEGLSEDITTSFPCRLQSTSPVFEPIDGSQIHETAAFSISFDDGASGLLDSWGLISPPSSVDPIEFSSYPELDDLFMTPASDSSAIGTTTYDNVELNLSSSNALIKPTDSEYALYSPLESDEIESFLPWPKIPSTNYISIEQSTTRDSRPEGVQLTCIPTFYHCNPARRMPALDEASRERVLHVIQRVSPRALNGIAITGETPLLSLQALQTYSDSFFSNFNDSMPLIHRPTFQPSTSEPLLLLAILLIGAGCEDEAAYEMVLNIYDVLPAFVLQQHVSSMGSELSRMQMLLLLEGFGRKYGNQQQLEMAHVYHTLLVQLLNRDDFSGSGYPCISRDNADTDLRWHTEMCQEERKRLAYFCFVMDTQSVMYFSRNPVMSVSALDLSLPCNPAAWEADSADEWSGYASMDMTSLSFRSILQRYLQIGSDPPRQTLSALSYVLILYGLIAISWDMKHKCPASLGCDTLCSIDSWGMQMAQSFNRWKAELDAYRIDFRKSLRRFPPTRDFNLPFRFRSFAGEAMILYHVANISLNASISDLEKCNTDPSSLNFGQRKGDCNQDIPKRRDSVQEEPTLHSICHAEHAIREAVLESEIDDESCLISTSWNLYFAVLIYTISGFLRQNEEADSPFIQAGALPSSSLCDSPVGVCHNSVSQKLNHEMVSAISESINSRCGKLSDATTATHFGSLRAGIRCHRGDSRASLLAGKWRALSAWDSQAGR